MTNSAEHAQPPRHPAALPPIGRQIRKPARAIAAAQGLLGPGRDVDEARPELSERRNSVPLVPAPADELDLSSMAKPVNLAGFPPPTAHTRYRHLRLGDGRAAVLLDEDPARHLLRTLVTLDSAPDAERRCRLLTRAESGLAVRLVAEAGDVALPRVVERAAWRAAGDGQGVRSASPGGRVGGRRSRHDMGQETAAAAADWAALGTAARPPPPPPGW